MPPRRPGVDATGAPTATLRDVATRAGVSVATVSHVVNRTRFVSPETEGRVQRAIASSGYAPNRLARALRRATTDSVGLIISDFGNPFYADIIRAVEEVCRKRRMSVLLASSGDEEQGEAEALASVMERRVDGLIIALTSETTLERVAELSAVPIPVVLIDRLVDAPIDQVGTENVRATMKLVSHLIERGHRRIGYLSGVPGISTTDERRTGYETALKAAGIPIDVALIRTGYSRVAPARDGALEMLASSPRCTAIVAGNNLMFLGALQAANEKGLGVPGDLALVGYDDFEWTDILKPRLTTMAQPTHQIGARAIAMLLSRIADRSAPTRTIRLPPTFMHRESCGCGALSRPGD